MQIGNVTLEAPLMLAPARRIVSGWGILRLILSMVSPICMSKNLF